MKSIFRWGWMLGIPVLLLVTSAWGAERSLYKAPDLKAAIFGGELTVDKAERVKTATALAGLVRNELRFFGHKPYGTAARVLGIALRLDPENHDAVVVNSELENGRPTKPKGVKWSKDDALKEIRRLAKAAEKGKGKGDRTLAAYLYAAMTMIVPSDDDAYALEMLKKDGITLDWSWAGENDGPIEAKATEKIKWVVAAWGPEGGMHGKVVEITATPGKEDTGFKNIHFQETRMDESFRRLNEAIKMCKERHKDIDKTSIVISFSEKLNWHVGASTGTALTLLILAEAGDLEISPDAAIADDLMEDATLRSVGTLPMKVHDLKDSCKVAAIAGSNQGQMEDAMILYGPSVLWEVQTLSFDTLDEAIGVMRKDRDPKMAQAIELFAELQKDLAARPLEQVLGARTTTEKLGKILSLAPNHVSAQYLQQLATGKKPARLSLNATVVQGLAATGAMRDGLNQAIANNELGSDGGLIAARKSLARLEETGDPAAASILVALEDFCWSYARMSNAYREKDIGWAMSLNGEFDTKRKAVSYAMTQTIKEKNVIAALMK